MIEWAFENPLAGAFIGAVLVATLFITIDAISSFFTYGEWL